MTGAEAAAVSARLDELAAEVKLLREDVERAEALMGAAEKSRLVAILTDMDHTDVEILGAVLNLRDRLEAVEDKIGATAR